MKQREIIKYTDSIAGSGLFRFISLIAVFVLIATTSSCTKHYATAVTAEKPMPAPVAASIKRDTLTPTSLSDSLIGTWKIRKTEIPEVVQKMMTYGSQMEKEEMIQKQKQYQAEFLSLAATFRGDRTYESSFSGQHDIGTWRVSRKLELETMSKISTSAMTFQVVSLENGILIAKYEANDMVLLLTFAKQ